MQHNHDRVSFGSKLGAILAAAGSAVGLGNIWRFPYEAGNHGGAAFILIYLGCIFIFGLPIMVAEFTIGRRAKASTGGSFSVLAPGTQWKWVGYLGVLTGFLILGYYSVVAGWTLEYLLQSVTGGFNGKDAEGFIAMFNEFSSDPKGHDAGTLHTCRNAGYMFCYLARSRKRSGISFQARFQ